MFANFCGRTIYEKWKRKRKNNPDTYAHTYGRICHILNDTKKKWQKRKRANQKIIDGKLQFVTEFLFRVHMFRFVNFFLCSFAPTIHDALLSHIIFQICVSFFLSIVFSSMNLQVCSRRIVTDLSTLLYFCLLNHRFQIKTEQNFLNKFHFFIVREKVLFSV